VGVLKNPLYKVVFYSNIIGPYRAGKKSPHERTMYRKPPPKQPSYFIPGSLADYIPEDHILKRVNQVLDLSWLREEVKALYDQANGRPCIDPERAVRLMLAGFFHGVVQDRKLIREAQVNIAYRWFAGYELDEALPDHSSLTRIRQRWGEERFRRIFEKIVAQCAQAGLIGGEMLHIDASLIRADVSWHSLVETHIAKVLAENETSEAETCRTGKPKKISTTDPEATLTTSCHQQRIEPSYKQHTAVDDKAGVIVDVHVTTGEVNEGKELLSQLARVNESVYGGERLQTITADSGYASSGNYAALEGLQVTAVIPPQSIDKTPHRGMPARRFAYDAQHDVVRCPVGNYLTRRSRSLNGWIYRARPADCRSCALRHRCLPPTARARSVSITDGYCALLRARRCKEKGWPKYMREAYHRHRWLVEGIHGEAKCEHGLRRAVRRGLSNIRIQAYLTAAVINLKRLAAHAGRLLGDYFFKLWRGYLRSWGIFRGSIICFAGK
jgi:transposase